LMVKRMRAVLRKLVDRIPLEEEEYRRLLAYTETLRSGSEESYRVFRDNYGSLLMADYGIRLPRFASGRAEFLEYLCQNWEVVQALKLGPLPVSTMPVSLQEYLRTEYGSEIKAEQVRDLVEWIERNQTAGHGLPRPRKRDPVLVYEVGNENKEIGLAQHFRRIARHPFVSRIVSVRYLSRGKAAQDRFEVRGEDVLSGIFTNKEKSIYYLVYLTEADLCKAANACNLLNHVFYG